MSEADTTRSSEKSENCYSCTKYRSHRCGGGNQENYQKHGQRYENNTCGLYEYCRGYKIRKCIRATVILFDDGYRHCPLGDMCDKCEMLRAEVEPTLNDDSLFVGNCKQNYDVKAIFDNGKLNYVAQDYDVRNLPKTRDSEVVMPSKATTFAAETNPYGGISMIEYINIEKIVPHPNNPRKDLGELSELSASIKTAGILQNLTVVPQMIAEEVSGPYGQTVTERTSVFVVIIGHRRLAAAKQAGLTEVPCVVAEMDEKTQIATMLLENMQRSDLTTYEQAQGFQLMLDMGENVESISQKTGFSQTTVRRRVKLLDLDGEKFKEAEARGGTLADYAELDKITDPALKNKVLESIGTSNFKWKLENAIAEEVVNVMRDSFLVTIAECMEEVDTKEGYDIYATVWHNKYNYNDFKMPEDVEERSYYFFRDNGKIYVLTEKTEGADEGDSEDSEAAERERERQEALEQASERSYRLRMSFAKTVQVTPKSADIIEQMAVQILIRGYGQVEEKAFGDYFSIEDGFKPGYGAKENDERETFDEAKRRLSTPAEHNSFRMLFAAVYLRLDRSTANYVQNWQYTYEANTALDRCYDMLSALGYEMSDEEKALQDGTHQLFVAEEPVDYDDEVPDDE